MAGSSGMGVGPPPLAMGGAAGMAMPPEILGHYLSSFDRRVKGVSRPANEAPAREGRSSPNGKLTGSWRPSNI